MPPAVRPKKRKKKAHEAAAIITQDTLRQCSLFPPPKQAQGKCHQPHPSCHPTLDALGLCLQSTLQWGPPTSSLLFLHCLQAGSPEAPQLTLTPPSLCSALFLDGPFLKLQVNLQNPAQASCPLWDLPQSLQSPEICCRPSCRLSWPHTGQLPVVPEGSSLVSLPALPACSTGLNIQAQMGSVLRKC